MKELPKDIALPTKEVMENYLNEQEQNVRAMNFRALVNKEVQKARLESAKAKDDLEGQRSAKDEIEKSELAIEGNEEYLAEIEKFRKII